MMVAKNRGPVALACSVVILLLFVGARAEGYHQRLSASSSHICALNSTGTVFCWGSNAKGELGQPGSDMAIATIAQNPHADTPVPLTESIVSISTGKEHSCALSVNGTIWCWGGGQLGQLGHGILRNEAMPVKVPHPQATKWVQARKWDQLSCGSEHSCAVDTKGSIWCWGRNDHGQLGRGTFIGSPTPLRVRVEKDVGGFSQITCGESHTCAISRTGMIFCWGGNAGGTLGVSAAITNTPQELKIYNSGDPWKHVSSGHGYTCGIDSNGKVKCWGRNDLNQLIDKKKRLSKNWSKISSGIGHTCGIQEDGSAWCWGRCDDYELGDGLSTGDVCTEKRPVKVVRSHKWVEISPGLSYTCGIDSQYVVWCWGSNQYGTLGDGTVTRRHVPVRVAFGVTVSKAFRAKEWIYLSIKDIVAGLIGYTKFAIVFGTTIGVYNFYKEGLNGINGLLGQIFGGILACLCLRIALGPISILIDVSSKILIQCFINRQELSYNFLEAMFNVFLAVFLAVCGIYFLIYYCIDKYIAPWLPAQLQSRWHSFSSSTNPNSPTKKKNKKRNKHIAD